MANWYLLSEQQASEMFAEATGANGIQVNFGQVAALLYDTQDVHHNLLPDDERKSLNRGFNSSTVASLGVFSFVYPYERYKKIAKEYPDRHLYVSEAFGLNNFSDRNAFLKAYPRTVITTWNPDTPLKPTWFADVVRNSFAHAQSRLRTIGQSTGAGACEYQRWNAPEFRHRDGSSRFLKLGGHRVEKFHYDGGGRPSLSAIDEIARN